ncbi:hypothetical protein DL990_30440 [Amycolatopsis sp. WAC 01416]|uniref:hypothetical protein n=1 Tax=Amycolatopsis sp. WAC 01416 TaxID=2203196 RepID=UPI000F780724|nr:hypothetical protein [Amycolatopsis sp. WAC 01416]RSN27496.1 hypothetical protein DL990_30440 [Amycolatopsis sp. WAC 01416]
MNLFRLRLLQTEFYEICDGPYTAAAFRRLAELGDEMATMHENEAAELRRLSAIATSRATCNPN